MKTKIINSDGKAGKEIEMPGNFSVKVRKDILAKVFESEKRKQATGSKVGAGAGYSASGILRHRRHVWKTTYGKGISRIPRKIFSRHGASFNWQGATVANTRGGRRAHPPKAWENQYRKINKKEFLIGFNSGLRGTVDAKLIEEKYGTKFDNVPVIFADDVLKLKTKEFRDLMEKIFEGLVEKAWKKKSIRAGRGKLRGRKYKSNAGLLFVVGKNEKMNRKGIEVVKANELVVKNLAPNGEPGRLAAYTENAIKEIGEIWK